MSHLYTNEHPTVAAVLLLRGIGQIDKLKLSSQKLTNLSRCQSSFISICGVEAVIVKCYAVENAHKKKGPVGAAFRYRGVAAVVDREEDVGCAGEVGKGFFKRERVGSLHEHEGHGWAEEDDVGRFVLDEVLVFEVPVDTVSLVTQSPR